MFYASDYLQNLPYYWMHNYFNSDMIKNNYIRLEYSFDGYNETRRLSEKYGNFEGLIDGNFNYSKKGGAIFYGKSGIKINGNLEMKVDDKANSSCVYFAFHYEEPLYDEFLMYRRGKKEEMNTFEVVLRKSGEKRIPVIKAFMSLNGTLKKREFKDSSIEISSGVRNEIQACFATGIIGINNAAFYVNKKTKIFENEKNLNTFDWNKMSKENRILDSEMGYGGNIKFDLITISEGSGGVIYRAETSKSVIKNFN